MNTRIKLISTLLAYAWATDVLAQSPVATASSSGATDTLEEVVVTAEKRSAGIMTTALAVSAVSGDALVDKNITNLEQLTATTPSFAYDNQGPTSAVNIRGIGLSVSSPNVAPGVPLYRDGLLAPTLLPNEPFLDIADVEVLRGPQGTLVGANSTGGAVFINTRNPSLDSAQGFAQLEGGSYNRLYAQGAYNQPISDSFAIRGAFSWEKRDSYWTDLQPTSAQHPAPGALNQIVARLSALYQPSDKLSVLFKVNYQDDQNGGMAHSPVAGTNAAAIYPTSEYVLNYADPNTEYSDYQIRAGLTIQYNFDSGMIFKSISGVFYTYEYYDDQQYVDPTPTTVASAPFINRINDHVYSQEFNLLSPADSTLHWVAGTFSQYWPAHVNITPNTTTVQVYEGTIKTSNAAFGEVGYDLSPAVEMHLGLRETFNHAYGTGGVYVIPADYLEVQSNRVGQTDDELTGRVGVNWKATADQFVYGFVAKGAKTGGINASGESNFSPETVYDYEAGVKSTWWDGHLKTQAGIFYMDYRNLQLAVETPAVDQAPVQTITNVGKSKIRGAELSAQSLFGGLQIDGNLAYVHSSVSSPPLLNIYLYQKQGLSPTGVQCPPGVTTGCFDYAPYYQSADGASNPYSPRWTGNLGAEYKFGVTNGATVTPRVDFSYTSTQYATIFANPVDEFQQRHILNLNVTYAINHFKVAVYGTNVTHDYYITGQTGAANLWGAPAEYGVRISQSF